MKKTWKEFVFDEAPMVIMIASAFVGLILATVFILWYVGNRHGH